MYVWKVRNKFFNNKIYKTTFFLQHFNNIALSVVKEISNLPLVSRPLVQGCLSWHLQTLIPGPSRKTFPVWPLPRGPAVLGQHGWRWSWGTSERWKVVYCCRVYRSSHWRMWDSWPNGPGGRRGHGRGSHTAGPNPTSWLESEAGHLQNVKETELDYLDYWYHHPNLSIMKSQIFSMPHK